MTGQNLSRSLHFPNAPCMEYLPKFPIHLSQTYVNIPYMEHWGFTSSRNVVLVLQALAIDATKRAHANQEPSMDVDDAIIIIQGIFALLFTFELTIRWVAEGLKEFWLSNDAGWNVLDAICCVIGVLDVTVELVSRSRVSDEPNPLRGVTVLRVLRIVRIVRVIRVIRIMKFFRELRMMIFSTLSSLQSVAWSE